MWFIGVESKLLDAAVKRTFFPPSIFQEEISYSKFIPYSNLWRERERVVAIMSSKLHSLQCRQWVTLTWLKIMIFKPHTRKWRNSSSVCPGQWSRIDWNVTGFLIFLCGVWIYFTTVLYYPVRPIPVAKTDIRTFSLLGVYWRHD